VSAEYKRTSRGERVEEALITFSQYIALFVEAVAIVIVAFRSAEAVVNVLRVMLVRASAGEKRDVWLRYARWLVAGLTFQLAGDIVRTTIAPTWNDIGMVGAIAVIRTFLTYFLDRDMEKTRAIERDGRSGVAA
jgi:uncharacterized membrane protein